MCAPWQIRKAFLETLEGLDLDEVRGDPTKPEEYKKGEHQLEALILFAYELGWQVGSDIGEWASGKIVEDELIAYYEKKDKVYERKK